LYSSYVGAKDPRAQTRPADAVRPGLNRLDIALAGNCDFGGPFLYLGLLRHHQRAQPGVGCQHAVVLVTALRPTVPSARTVRGLVQGEAGACGPGALNRIAPTGAFSGALRDAQPCLQCGCPSGRRCVSAPWAAPRPCAG
jgi:hypothetical protein